MRTWNATRILLLLIGSALAAGCASVSGGRPVYAPRLRTLTSIGDKPLSTVAGTPGASVAAGDDVAESRVATDGRISGRVYDERGRPAAGVEVRVTVGGDAAGRLVRARTDDAGGFTLHGLREGAQYNLVAERDDGTRYLVGKKRATTGARGVEIALANPDARGPEPGGARVRTASDAQPADDSFEDNDPDEGPRRVNEDDLPPAVEAEALLSPRRGIARRAEDGTIAPTGGSRWRQGDEDGPDDLPSRPVADDPGFEERDPLPPARERPRGREFEDIPPPPARSPVASPVAQEAAPEPVRAPASRPTPAAAPVNPPPIPPVDRPAPPAIPDVPASGPAPAATTPPPPMIPDLAGEPARTVPDPAPAAEPPPQAAPASGPAIVEPPVIPEAQPAAAPANPPGPSVVESPAQEVAAPPDVVAPPLAEAAPPAANEPAPLPPTDTAEALPEPTEPAPIAPPADAPEFPAENAPPPVEPVPAADNEGPAPIVEPTDEAAPQEPNEEATAQVEEPIRRPTWGEVAAQAPERPPVAQTRPAANPPAAVADDSVNSCQFDAKNQRLVDFAVPDLRGRAVRFREIDADLILLDFWGTWCGPCVKSIPQLIALQKQFGERRIQVLGIACEQGPPASRAARVADAARKLGVNYLIAMGSPVDGEPSPLQQALNVQVYPTMVLIDRQGRILWREQGSTAQTLARLERVVASNFGGDVIRR